MSRLTELLKNKFGFKEFRPHQEAVCRTVFEGKDVLLVMPTGAGKSLCYQLPGLAREGTTLVISPLLALIEDQVEKLNRMGMKADRIHSGRTREESRKACIDYLSGAIDFLFIAPERLAVPGFIEMLAKRTPALIAIDEAHCISHWGHDFRPNYRLLGQRLRDLRPAPVIAMTATATPLVQQDIVKQLQFSGEVQFIQGFRRKNIAIQVWNVDPSQRLSAVLSILQKRERFPAIIYAPTRKAAEKLTSELLEHYPTLLYHAGLTADERERAQQNFLSGKVDLIVATVAFGMGVDKPNIRTVIHAGLPGSIEGYYQEIGRAGRDGLPSVAILLHSYADQRTHEFFLNRDYPDTELLEATYALLSAQPVSKQDLFSALQRHRPLLKTEAFDKALEKLWIHQGGQVHPEERVSVGKLDWRKTYIEQLNHRRKQLKQMLSFTETFQCRMKALVQHFGDQTDSAEDCGLCDVCAPDQEGLLAARESLSREEQTLVASILASLAGQEQQAVGRLFADASRVRPDLDRRRFESLLRGLCEVKWVDVVEASFVREGERIVFRRVSLTLKGKEATSQQLSELKMAGLKPKKKKKATRKRSTARSGWSNH